MKQVFQDLAIVLTRNRWLDVFFYVSCMWSLRLLFDFIVLNEFEYSYFSFFLQLFFDILVGLFLHSVFKSLSNSFEELKQKKAVNYEREVLLKELELELREKELKLVEREVKSKV